MLIELTHQLRKCVNVMIALIFIYFFKLEFKSHGQIKVFIYKKKKKKKKYNTYT